MCSNYLSAKPASLETHFGIAGPAQEMKPEIFPGYLAPIIRLTDVRENSEDREESGRHECQPAMFGMVPGWADMKLSRSTYNARTETVAIKPSFRHAWKKGQFCIVPAESIFEPSYESGKAVRWNIAAADDTPLGIAGIWEWRSNGLDGQPMLSFSMLTINADDHPLMRRFHKPTDEKRMLVFLEPHEYDNWLNADAEEARSFLTPYPAERLIARPMPVRSAVRGMTSDGQSENGSLF